ncbi:putative bifunctional diguanylate cyclase/phosphodiesterase [Roseateles cellulosilyticus]|uniref:EAL domain-containing protein n=1 Tax=Pelomonas cellulosilytica TaxID=2906762 RepID=A0ABS8XKP7_9BURK|nr:GGDEF domain-containing phosphodiesterase [Pelomonas sp. P8]MCE4553399.1 EAL domain-containing protein [Pelomonas sp. P8]
MDLSSSLGDSLDTRLSGVTASDPGSTTTLPPGPRRIKDRRGSRRLRRVGLAALAGLMGGIVIAWVLAGQMLPAALRLPQPAGSLPAAGWFLPMLIVALGLTTLWRLGAWVLPAVMPGLLLGCSVPLLAVPGTSPLSLLASPPLLGTLALPLVAAGLNRTLMRRLGLTGRLAGRRDIGLFGLLAGIVVPLLAGLSALAMQLAGGVPRPEAGAVALQLGGAWALALLAAGTALQAGSQRPQRDERWPGLALAAIAVMLQAAQHELSANPALLLAPQLLLCLHAWQASPRHNAQLGVGLLALWALGTPGGLLSHVAGGVLALLPLTVIALSQHRLRDRDGWRTALDAQGLALAEWRLPSSRRHASARWVALTTEPGAAPSDGPLDWMRAVHPRDRELSRRALRELLGRPGNDRLGLSLRIAADGGDWRWHELQAHVPQRDRKGRARNLVMTLADVSWRHASEERERLSATLFQQATEGLVIVDMQWRIVEVNPAGCEILHATRETLIGRLAAPLSVANLQRSGYQPGDLQAALMAGRSWSGQLQAELDDGGHHVFAARLSPVPEPDDAPARWRLLSLSDLGESLRQQELLRRSLRYDLATGLPNREEFMRLLPEAMAAANRDGFKLVIGVIDLDDFASVNAQHGQLVADAVLLQLSGRLQSTLRGARGSRPDTADRLARLHGDEFGVLLRVQTPEEGQRAVDRLLGLLSTPVAIRESRVGDGLALEIGASMGATLFPLDDADPETLLRHAGHALYRAKHAGRSSVQFHNPALHQRDEAALIALAQLQHALDNDELQLHYQPQIDLRTGLVMGAEALLRWRHPERGLLTPAHFLPLTETSGLAVQIGDWVIEQALAQAAAWRRDGINGGRGLPVSVNVGARQLCRPDFPQRLQELIQRHPPGMAALLNLDVLESDALAETEATQALIQRCLALGVGIALDDFGAGYSHLASLKRLTVDTLKLDRSYVQGMLGDAQDLSLVESVIGLARNIGCAVLAKGVESRAHARELQRLGCRLGQGNGIAAAMHPMALPDWIEGFVGNDWAGPLKPPTQTPSLN